MTSHHLDEFLLLKPYLVTQRHIPGEIDFRLQANLGPVDTNSLAPVVPKMPPIKARGEKFGYSK